MKKMLETCKINGTLAGQGGRVRAGRVHRLRKGVARTGNMARRGAQAGRSARQCSTGRATQFVSTFVGSGRKQPKLANEKGVHSSYQ